MTIKLLKEGTYEAGSISIITLVEVLGEMEPKKGAKVKELLEEGFNLLTL